MASRSGTGALGAGAGGFYTNPFGTASPFPQLNFLLSQPSPPTTWFLWGGLWPASVSLRSFFQLRSMELPLPRPSQAPPESWGNDKGGGFDLCAQANSAGRLPGEASKGREQDSLMGKAAAAHPLPGMPCGGRSLAGSKAPDLSLCCPVARRLLEPALGRGLLPGPRAMQEKPSSSTPASVCPCVSETPGGCVDNA